MSKHVVRSRFPRGIRLLVLLGAGACDMALAAPTPDDWQTYRNEQAGYIVKYPGDWKADEGTTHETIVTTFTPAAGGAGITVSAQPGEVDKEVVDIPNARCQPVTVGGLPGTRCFDTLSFSTSTTLVGRGKTYVIATSGKRLDQNIYQRFLDNFKLLL